jgi:hypothetical protein
MCVFRYGLQLSSVVYYSYAHDPRCLQCRITPALKLGIQTALVAWMYVSDFLDSSENTAGVKENEIRKTRTITFELLAYMIVYFN